jgi:hypothetical protein
MSPHSCSQRSVLSVWGSRCKKRYWKTGCSSIPEGQTDSMEASSWDGLWSPRGPSWKSASIFSWSESMWASKSLSLRTSKGLMANFVT